MERTFLVMRFDVTDLDENQRDYLAMEASVQAEASDGHPGVECPSCEFVIEEVES